MDESNVRIIHWGRNLMDEELIERFPRWKTDNFHYTFPLRGD